MAQYYLDTLQPSDILTLPEDHLWRYMADMKHYADNVAPIPVLKLPGDFVSQAPHLVKSWTGIAFNWDVSNFRSFSVWPKVSVPKYKDMNAEVGRLLLAIERRDPFEGFPSICTRVAIAVCVVYGRYDHETHQAVRDVG